MIMSKKKLKNPTGSNMTWGVFKAHAFFFCLKVHYCMLYNNNTWSCSLPLDVSSSISDVSTGTSTANLSSDSGNTSEQTEPKQVELILF